jgi:hypothetical protein
MIWAVPNAFNEGEHVMVIRVITQHIKLPCNIPDYSGTLQNAAIWRQFIPNSTWIAFPWELTEGSATRSLVYIYCLKMSFLFAECYKNSGCLVRLKLRESEISFAPQKRKQRTGWSGEQMLEPFRSGIMAVSMTFQSTRANASSPCSHGRSKDDVWPPSGLPRTFLMMRAPGSALESAPRTKDHFFPCLVCSLLAFSPNSNQWQRIVFLSPRKRDRIFSGDRAWSGPARADWFKCAILY